MKKNPKTKRTKIKDLAAPEQALTNAEASTVKGGAWWGITHGAAPANTPTSTPTPAPATSSTTTSSHDTAMNSIRNMK